MLYVDNTLALHKSLINSYSPQLQKLVENKFS